MSMGVNELIYHFSYLRAFSFAISCFVHHFYSKCFSLKNLQPNDGRIVEFPGHNIGTWNLLDIFA